MSEYIFDGVHISNNTLPIQKKLPFHLNIIIEFLVMFRYRPATQVSLRGLAETGGFSIFSTSHYSDIVPETHKM